MKDGNLVLDGNLGAPWLQLETFYDIQIRHHVTKMNRNSCLYLVVLPKHPKIPTNTTSNSCRRMGGSINCYVSQIPTHWLCQAPALPPPIQLKQTKPDNDKFFSQTNRMAANTGSSLSIISFLSKHAVISLLLDWFHHVWLSAYSQEVISLHYHDQPLQQISFNNIVLFPGICRLYY